MRSVPVTVNRPHSPLNPGNVAKPKGFVERDFSEAPSFTQPLADHTSTPGYSTQLFCSVRASPKVNRRALLCPGRVGAGRGRILTGFSTKT